MLQVWEPSDESVIQTMATTYLNSSAESMTFGVLLATNQDPVQQELYVSTTLSMVMPSRLQLV